MIYMDTLIFLFFIIFIVWFFFLNSCFIHFFTFIQSIIFSSLFFFYLSHVSSSPLHSPFLFNPFSHYQTRIRLLPSTSFNRSRALSSLHRSCSTFKSHFKFYNDIFQAEYFSNIIFSWKLHPHTFIPFYKIVIKGN